jgi:hypothetical protein
MKFSLASLLALLVAINEAKNTQRNIQARSSYNPKRARQLPADPVGVKTLTTPQNITIRYKEPGKEGVCETTPGVNSYSGYIDLDVRTSTSPHDSLGITNRIKGEYAYILLVLRGETQSERGTCNSLAQWRSWFRLDDWTF